MHHETFRSKSFWAGLAMLITGIGLCLNGDTPQGLQTVATGLATIFVRDAITKATPPRQP